MNHSNPSPSLSLAQLLQHFFVERLLRQLRASPHTVRSYRDSFRQFLVFASKHLRQPPSRIVFEQIDAPLVSAFLDDIECTRDISVRTRNLRLTAIHSFFRYAAFELPTHGLQIQRVLAIPSKRFVRKQVGFLNRDEVDALLDAPDRSSWSGRRDYAFILTAVQTGLRVSEIIQLGRVNLELGASAHLRVIGKGRKERCVPLAVSTRNVLKAWLLEPQRGNQSVLFPNRHGNPLTIHGVQYLLGKHHEMAVHQCPSLKHKRVTVHLLRHTTAMDLLQAGVDRSTIALWLGHASVVSTEPYIEATLAIKQKALAKVAPLDAAPRRFQATDTLLAFLDRL